MFIFGGKGPRDIVYKDVYFLDLIEWVWVPVNTISNAPSPRFMHASEVVGRKIVVHGGRDNDVLFDDLWIFNTDSFVWMQPRTAGFGPSPRYGHSLTLTPDGRLLVIGGCSMQEESGIPKYNDDIRQLDTETMVWTRPRVSGHLPTGRYGHTATLLSDGRILVNELNLIFLLLYIVFVSFLFLVGCLFVCLFVSQLCSSRSYLEFMSISLFFFQLFLCPPSSSLIFLSCFLSPLLSYSVAGARMAINPEN
jgi:hypothetical protein